MAAEHKDKMGQASGPRVGCFPGLKVGWRHRKKISRKKFWFLEFVKKEVR
jgi:hypothetical protein